MRTGAANGIPYKLVYKAEHPGPRPLIIGAYGALNIAWLPAYLFALPAAWVHLGGVYVQAHLRGGGEYGTDWWQAARRHTKQTTFGDLYTVATDLINQGWTTSEQLGVLPTAVAATQRPQLFRACVAVMPVLDLLRCCKNQATMADIVATDLGTRRTRRTRRCCGPTRPTTRCATAPPTQRCCSTAARRTRVVQPGTAAR
jgi:prolyl oligopeptidase